MVLIVVIELLKTWMNCAVQCQRLKLARRAITTALHQLLNYRPVTIIVNTCIDTCYCIPCDQVMSQLTMSVVLEIVKIIIVPLIIQDLEVFIQCSTSISCSQLGGGTSMKTIVPDDSLTDNTSGYHSDASNSQGTIGTKRESSFYQPAAKRKQRQRKREQDKLAALKYRSRKKQEVLALDEQQAKLELENATLVKQVKLAEKEIVMLKSLLREIYAPCNHGNPTSTMPQSSTSMINTATSVTHSNTAVNDSNVTDYLSQCSIGSAVHPLCHQLKERLDTSTNGEDWSHSKTLQAGWNNVVQPNVFAVIWNHVFTLYNKKHV